MGKAIATFFLVMLMVFTGFFVFSYFATAEYEGHGILYTQFYPTSVTK
ncbi:hypothetical protein [Bacillus rhizoplanae]